MFVRSQDYRVNISFEISKVSIPAIYKNTRLDIPFDTNTLESHLAIFGGTRSGKTTFIKNLVTRLRYVHPNDLYILLNVKDDYNDLLQSNDAFFSVKNPTFHWSILKEAYDSSYPEDALNEITMELFHEELTKSHNKFFPETAQKVLYGLLLFQLRNNCIADNKTLANWIRSLSLIDIKNILHNVGLGYIAETYLYAGQTKMNGQNGAILSTMHLILDYYFVQDDAVLMSTKDILAVEGNLLLLQYDIQFQKSSNYLMKLLLKLIIKRKLSRNAPERRVYLILDEASVLDGDFDLVQVLNIGAGKRIHVILGLQSIELLYRCLESPDEHLQQSVLGGFQNFVFFRPRDSPTKDFIVHLGGQDMIETSVFPTHISGHTEIIVQKDDLISTRDIEALTVGEAYLKILDQPMFKVKFLKGV